MRLSYMRRRKLIGSTRFGGKHMLDAVWENRLGKSHLRRIQGRTAARFLVDSVSRVGCLHRYETIKTGKVLAGSRVLRLLVV